MPTACNDRGSLAHAIIAIVGLLRALLAAMFLPFGRRQGSSRVALVHMKC